MSGLMCRARAGGKGLIQMTSWRIPLVSQTRLLNLQEYQSKEIMASHGLKVQNFRVVSSQQEASDVMTGSKAFTCSEYVIKAQVLAGGRGKGTFKKSGMKGGVKLTKDGKEVPIITGNMLNDYLVTKQTTKDGVLVKKVMIAQALDIVKEFYAAILLDRSMGGIVLVASKFGGMNIEEVAEKDPKAIFKFLLPNDPKGLTQSAAEQMVTSAFELTNPIEITRGAEQIVALHRLFVSTDATMIEINPLGVTPDREVVCFDAKLDFDENADFRQRWLGPYKEEAEQDEDERVKMASEAKLNFVPMDDGNIGCLVNGAGLAMATMDIIKLNGGSPANFLDVGGGVTKDGVLKAFQLITQDPKVKCILVNIFGGIVNCETVAHGLIAAKSLIKVPLVVRLEGTSRDSAMKMLNSVEGIITAVDLDDAAFKAIQCTR